MIACEKRSSGDLGEASLNFSGVNYLLTGNMTVKVVPWFNLLLQ